MLNYEEAMELLTELKHQYQDHEIDYDYYMMATMEIGDLFDTPPDDDEDTEVEPDQDDSFADCEMF